MADKDDPKTEIVEEPKEEKPVAEEKPKSDTAATPDATQMQAELERLRAALKERNKEEAARRKKLEELEAAEQKRKELDMTELEKRDAQIKALADEKVELLNKQKQFERRELQRKVAKDSGLPDGLAERLHGETEEEMKDDAKILLELMPKQETTPAKPPPVKILTTNPGDGQKGETLAQQKARLGMTRGVNTWDKDFAKSHGGGASAPEQE